MFDLKRMRKNKENGETVNIAPLIDMVFILLIFFIVTSKFSNDSSVTVNTPSAGSANESKNKSIVFSILQNGAVYYENRIIRPEIIKSIVKKKIKEFPETAVLIRADKNSKTASLVSAIDYCKSAGAENIQIAADNKDD